MLTNDRLIELLDHPDRAVRTQAARLLADAHDPSPATACDLIKAIERFPERTYPCLWTSLTGFKHDDASIKWLLHRLMEEAPYEANPLDNQDFLNLSIRVTLEKSLASLDFDQLLRHRDAIAAEAMSAPDIAATIDRRLSLAMTDPESLWRQFASWMDKGHDLPSYHYQERLDLYQAMAMHTDVLGDRVVAGLAGSIAGWQEWHLIEAAGWMRRRDAIPHLLRIMLENDDESDIGEPLMYAMSRIGDPAVIPVLTEGFDDRSYGFKLYSGEVLERLRHPDGEAAALRLLKTSKDQHTIGSAVRVLVELGTDDDEALQILREFAVEERFDPSWGDLREDLITLYQMLDRELPEAEVWRRAIAADRLNRGSLLDRLERMRRAPSNVVDDDPDEDRPMPIIETYRREEPKVGRNDKCRCGSGKKYKACCLRIEQTLDRV